MCLSAKKCETLRRTQQRAQDSGLKGLGGHGDPRIKDYTQKVEDHTNNTRRCTVNMSINIDGKWYDAEGSYIFGPSLSQNEACKKADDRAKEDVLRLAAPEVVTGQKYLNCHSGYRTVDLVPEKEDNKICSKVFFDALIDNELIKVWGYDCNG